jgi:hypothetical protein
MTRVRKAALILALALAAASFSYSCRRTFELADERAAPIDPAYIAYTHTGSMPNPVHPVSYQASALSLARSDPAGRIVIPGVFHAHLPFPIKTHPALDVRMVYVPRLHNAWGRFHEHAQSQPGVFVIDSPGNRAIVSDLAPHPGRWQGTLSNLASIINQLTVPEDVRRPPIAPDPTTVALTRELIAHFRQEYTAFLAQYRETLRPVPEMPPYARWSTPEEQQRWKETADAHLAAEPTWGALVTRLYEFEVQNFEAWTPD